MARLNQPPDLTYATPANNRTSDAVTNSRLDMSSSPPLRPLSLETGLQSYGNDNLSASPPRCGSGRPLLSPADCRTLEKILHDVVSPPATPSPLEQSDKLFIDGGCASTAGAADGGEGYHFVGGEATDTGYEDEDDSMELSEGGEVDTAKKTVTSLGDPASPSVSKSDRRLQESVSVHDGKEKLRYSRGRRSSTTKRIKAKWQEQKRITPLEATGGDTIEDVMNIPGKRAPPARPLDLGRRDSDHQVPGDINQLNRMRLSMKKVLEQERAEQEHAEGEGEPGVFITTSLSPEDLDESERDGFDADNEETQSRFSLGITGVPHRKVCENESAGCLPNDVARLTWNDQISQGNAPKSPDQTSPVVPRTISETAILVPSTPTPATQTPEPAHIQFVTNHNMPETPFTKTLSYFKQYKGTENSPSKRRRTTALPQEIAEVTEDVIDLGIKTSSPEEDETQPVVRDASVSTATSALVDLEAMAHPDDNINAVSAAFSLRREDGTLQVSASTDTSLEQAATENETVMHSTVDDAQKQVILYPQHPAFVNAIGMIPATMFWATAAPIIKYSGIAVELLIDKLRDTYL